MCYSPTIGIGGCLPRPRFPRFPGCFPGRGQQHHRTGADMHVGWRNNWWGGGHSVKGYGIDLNGDGRFNRGKDGVLVFDFNRDGKYSDNEISRSNDLMKAFRGDFDFNGDGRVCRGERARGRCLQRQARAMDKNRNGRLEANEISAAGGGVWIDKDKDGKFDCGERRSVYNLPGRFGEWGGRRLDYVDPFSGSARTSRNNHWWNPRPWFPSPVFGGGGGCGFGRTFF